MLVVQWKLELRSNLSGYMGFPMPTLQYELQIKKRVRLVTTLFWSTYIILHDRSYDAGCVFPRRQVSSTFFQLLPLTFRSFLLYKYLMNEKEGKHYADEAVKSLMVTTHWQLRDNPSYSKQAYLNKSFFFLFPDQTPTQ